MPYYKNVGLSPVSYFDVVINPGQIEFLPSAVMNKNLISIKFYSAKDNSVTDEDSTRGEDVSRRTKRTYRKRKTSELEVTTESPQLSTDLSSTDISRSIESSDTGDIALVEKGVTPIVEDDDK